MVFQLTCKDFLDVALDALWKEMDFLMPLVGLLPTLQLKNEEYVCANVHVFPYNLIFFFFRSLVEMCPRRIGIDCNITLEESSFS